MRRITNGEADQVQQRGSKEIRSMVMCTQVLNNKRCGEQGWPVTTKARIHCQIKPADRTVI